MKKRMLLTAVALATMTLSFGVYAADTASQPEIKAVKAGEASIHGSGTITAIDKENRVVTIKGDRGNVFDLTVGPDAKNFDALKVGDRVNAEYRRAIALALKKGGAGIRADVESTASTSAAKGEQPGGAVARRQTIVANVISVDKKHNTIRVKGPKGRVVDVEVDDPDVMHQVKKGDQVVAVVTDALAISVTPAAK
ncbi:hypothetical protein [Silvimonas amylolytica]|uniref:Hyperosmotically inducible protein n=1 Tax=Silvimonas amylolytica TaxID=449663 RepID=A0ABQ2PGG7_9NEIS|nr:hypothetical protein [Silvimonas amylolytica]GGP24650.1 hypothetical protein GCM10010971_04690 [Silvimonas amylolytica]